MADDVVDNVQAACMSAFCGTWEFGGLCPGCAAGAEVVRLRAAIDALLAAVDAEHRTRADGVEVCVLCAPTDGLWPCSHRVVFDALKAARDWK